MDEVMKKADIVELGGVLVHPALEQTRSKFIEQFGEKEARRGCTDNDWKRLSFVMDKASDGSCFLDVGTGQGHLSNAMGCLEKYSNVTTIDIKTSTKYCKYFPHDKKEMSVTDINCSICIGSLI